MATLRNNIVSSESLIDFPKGQTIEQVGQPFEFSGFLYVKNVDGKAYRAEDFTYLLEEVTLTPKPKPENKNTMFWILGGIAILFILKK